MTMPLMKYRWTKKNRMMTGMLMAVEAAMSSSQRVDSTLRYDVSPTATVKLSVEFR